jgi:DNA mismatch endonuclease (patch repair protein)
MTVLRAPKPLDSALSERMRRQRTRDTAAELAVRRLLHSAGCRFRVQFPVPGLPRRTIDIAFPARRLAVNIDGCFWHGCHVHRSLPVTNYEWWQRKIEENRRRDKETDAHLFAIGWRALRFCEHEPLEIIVARVISEARTSGVTLDWPWGS